MNRRAALWLLLAAGLSGCLAPPNLHYPGPAEYQQARANVFDPYPESEPAPAVEGGRPREYAKPVPEVDRVRRPHQAREVNLPWMPWTWGQSR